MLFLRTSFQLTSTTDVNLTSESSNSRFEIENIPSTSEQTPGQIVHSDGQDISDERNLQDRFLWNTNEDDFELSQLMESEREKLQRNEEIRAQMWSKFVPFLTLALFLYISLSIIWIVYNFAVYRRQRLKSSECAKISWNSKLLRAYEEMPTYSTASNTATDIVVTTNPEVDDSRFAATSVHLLCG